LEQFFKPPSGVRGGDASFGGLREGKPFYVMGLSFLNLRNMKVTFYIFDRIFCFVLIKLPFFNDSKAEYTSV
jgi:hypothetical protein